MRIAIVSDIHGNLTAFEAVLVDLRETAPDLVLHGGDLAHSGARPCEVIDRVRELGWSGVLGNTDEMLYRRESLTTFAAQTPSFQPLFPMIDAMATATREKLGDDRLAWLRTLPPQQAVAPVALVHASPASLWRAPFPDATDADLQAVYGPLDQPVAVYAHIHRSYIRKLACLEQTALTVANTGSVSLSLDGDPRASYLLVDDGVPAIRRVVYDLEKEVVALAASDLPHAAWVGQCLRAGRFLTP